jgi:hypothetical protein
MERPHMYIIPHSWLWHPDQLQRFDALYGELGEEEKKIAKGMFEEAGSILASAVSDMWEARKDQPEFDPDEGKYAQERRGIRDFTGSSVGTADTVIRTVGIKRRSSPRSEWKKIVAADQTVMEDYLPPAKRPKEEEGTARTRLPRYGLSAPNWKKPVVKAAPPKKSGWIVFYGDGRVVAETDDPQTQEAAREIEAALSKARIAEGEDGDGMSIGIGGRTEAAEGGAARLESHASLIKARGDDEAAPDSGERIGYAKATYMGGFVTATKRVGGNLRVGGGLSLPGD